MTCNEHILIQVAVRLSYFIDVNMRVFKEIPILTKTDKEEILGHTRAAMNNHFKLMGKKNEMSTELLKINEEIEQKHLKLRDLIENIPAI